MTKKSFILLLVLSLAFAACGGAEEETVEEPAVVEEAETLDAPATTVAETLDKITFGFIPSAEQADLQDNIKPLMKVLTDGLGIEVEGFVTSDFSGLLVAMGSGQADIGAFNTLGYVNALNVFPTRIEAIAKVVRYGSGSYHANFWTTDPSVCDSPPVIGAFENMLANIVALAAFIPVILGMGGNIATQSSTIIVRGMATGRVNIGGEIKLIFKEIKVGLILGSLYGVLLGVFAKFTFTSAPDNLGFVVGLSICASMIVAATVGTIIPLILRKLDIDPAIATGPFVTTSIDILGVLFYFLIAGIFLKI